MSRKVKRQTTFPVDCHRWWGTTCNFKHRCPIITGSASPSLNNVPNCLDCIACTLEMDCGENPCNNFHSRSDLLIILKEDRESIRQSSPALPSHPRLGLVIQNSLHFNGSVRSKSWAKWSVPFGTTEADTAEQWREQFHNSAPKRGTCNPHNPIGNDQESCVPIGNDQESCVLSQHKAPDWQVFNRRPSWPWWTCMYTSAVGHLTGRHFRLQAFPTMTKLGGGGGGGGGACHSLAIVRWRLHARWKYFDTSLLLLKIK